MKIMEVIDVPTTKSLTFGALLLIMGRETKGCVIDVSDRSERRLRNIFRQVRDVPIL